MFEVEITTGFAAAHRLRDYNGKCERLHGHNYKVKAVCRSESVGSGGMLIDFGHLKSAVKETIELLDHSYLNDIAPFTEIEPSAEHIARFIFQEARKCLGDKGSLLYSISVWESDSSKASYFE